MKIGDTFQYVNAGVPGFDPEGYWHGTLIVYKVDEDGDVYAYSNKNSSVSGLFSPDDCINEKLYKFHVGDEVWSNGEQFIVSEIDYSDDLLSYRLVDENQNVQWASDDELMIVNDEAVYNCPCVMDNVTILNDDEITTNEEISILLLKQTYEERLEFVDHLREVIFELIDNFEDITDMVMAEALSVVAKETLDYE